MLQPDLIKKAVLRNDSSQLLHGVSRLLILAWHIQHHGIAFATHCPDVAELHHAGLAHVAYQSLLVCTG